MCLYVPVHIYMYNHVLYLCTLMYVCKKCVCVCVGEGVFSVSGGVWGCVCVCVGEGVFSVCGCVCGGGGCGGVGVCVCAAYIHVC